MPGGGLAAEAGGEAGQEGLGQRNFGEEDEGLFAAAEAGGDRLEIDFGLARAGDSVEQDRVEAGSGGEDLGGGLLVLGERRRGEVGVGEGERAVGVDCDGFQRPGGDQPAQDGVADLRDVGQFADGALTAGETRDGLAPLRGEAGGDDVGRAIFDQLARGGEGAAARQDHAQDGGERGKVVVGGPLGEAAQRGGDRGHVDEPGEGAEAVVADFLGRQALGFPRDADQLARAERSDDDGAGGDQHPVGHAIVERAEGGVEGDDAGAGEGHGYVSEKGSWVSHEGTKARRERKVGFTRRREEEGRREGVIRDFVRMLRSRFSRDELDSGRCVPHEGTKARRHEGRSLAGTDERRGTINHAAEAVTEGFAAEVHEQPEGLLGQTKIGQQLLGVHGRSAFD